MTRRVGGRWKRVSAARRLIVELMRACRGVPVVTIERRMRLGDLVAARDALARPPAWVAVFAKAFAVVARRRPELRTAYLPWPWPRFYEAEASVGSVAVEREIDGEPAVLFAQFRRPDREPLAVLHAAVGQWRTAPVAEVREFRRLARLMRLPGPLRRAWWWYLLKVAGPARVRHVGTFAVSTTAAAGASCLNLIAPTPVALNYGPLAADGSLDVRLHFDHRVLDGMPAARALADLEAVLTTDVLAELRAMAAGPNRLGVRNVEVAVSHEGKRRVNGHR